MFESARYERGTYLGMTELKSFSVSPITSEQEDETVIVSRTPPPAPSNSPADTMRRTPDVVVDELRLDEPACFGFDDHCDDESSRGF